MSADSFTYYISPRGSDDNDGRSLKTPWKTFSNAIPQLEPGDILGVMDGIYEKENTGFLDIDCRKKEVCRGKQEKPIIVRAVNERQAWLKGDGLTQALRVSNCKWWIIEGLRISSRDNPESSAGDIVSVSNSSNIILRRLLAHHNNRYANCHPIVISMCRNVLVEETEFYYFHRNGIVAWQSDKVTVRRCYGNSRGYGDIPDGRYSGNKEGGDRTFVGYYASNFLVENCVSENKNCGFGIISGEDVESDLSADKHLERQHKTPLRPIHSGKGSPSGENAWFLGIISLGDSHTGAIQSRNLYDYSEPVRNVLVKDFLMVNSSKSSFSIRTADNLVMKNITAIDAAGPVISTFTSGNKQLFSCEEIGGCKIRISNCLIMNTDGKAVRFDSQPDIIMEHSNFWNNSDGPGVNEDLRDNEGRIRFSTQVKPTNIGLEPGKNAVFIPENSNMKGAGKDGQDIGANILNRYEDGELTDKPLWNFKTGEFPHGAIVSGINDRPGDSLFDLHERLNIT